MLQKMNSGQVEAGVGIAVVAKQKTMDEIMAEDDSEGSVQESSDEEEIRRTHTPPIEDQSDEDSDQFLKRRNYVVEDQ